MDFIAKNTPPYLNNDIDTRYAYPTARSLKRLFDAFDKLSFSIPKEYKCFHCGKMNDIEINNCWWCQSLNPTKK